MAYTGIGFVNDNPPAINAENLNKMDNGIVDTSKDIDAIKNTGKWQNLFDASTIVQGGYYGGRGQINEDENSYYSIQYIPVTAGVQYSFTPDNDKAYFVTYDSNKEFIERIDPSGTTHTFNTGVKFIRISMYRVPFPTGYKFAKTTDFNQVSSNYGWLIDGGKIMNGTVNKNVLASDSGIEEELTTAITLSKLTQNTKVFTIIPNTYINTSGGFETSNAYTSYVFQAVSDFKIWINNDNLSQMAEDLFLGVYDSAPPSNFITPRKRRKIESGSITASTMPQSDSKLQIYKGQYILISRYNVGNKGFVFDVSNFKTGEKIFNTNVLLNESQIAGLDNGVSVKVETGKYTLTLNGYDVILRHEVDANNRADLWTIRGITKNDVTICNAGTDIIGVLREIGQTDFMGGLHGDETNIEFYILGDGKAISSDSVFKQVDVLMISHLTRPSTGDNVIDRFVHIVFKENYIEIENTFKCLVDNFNLDYAYNGGLFAWYDSAASFQMSNIGEISSGGGNTNATLQANKNLFSTTALIGNNCVTVENIIGHEKDSFMGEVYYYGSSDKRIKTYFSTEHETTWNNGNVCKGKCRYTLA